MEQVLLGFLGKFQVNVSEVFRIFELEDFKEVIELVMAEADHEGELPVGELSEESEEGGVDGLVAEEFIEVVLGVDLHQMIH
jgi:hypothetical protein